jgi:tRNA (guanine-N7-)-methyltransferase
VGRKNKLKRFAEMEQFPNVFQPSYEEVLQNDFPKKGKWHDEFGNSHPIVLELGCGKGEYTIGLSQYYPKKNFIGIDIKGARIWKGAKYAHENRISNVRFLRTRIEFISHFFDKEEVSEIWITFPDPQLKEARAKKRLTAPRFLEYYRSFLKPDHRIHLKTDSRELYDYTMTILQARHEIIYRHSSDIYADFPDDNLLKIKTFYEERWLEEGKKITYIEFSLR